MSSGEIVVPGRRRLRLTRLWWLGAWILVAGVLIGCLEPARYVPNFHVGDKFEHAGAYFLMGFWFGGLLDRRSYPVLILGLLLLGALIEVAQGLMGWGRTADVWDFAADAVGVSGAMALAYCGLGSWMRHIESYVGLSREPT